MSQALTPENESSGWLVLLDRRRRAGPDGRTGAAPAVGVLIAGGQALVRAGFRALLETRGRITVVGEASTGKEVASLAARLRPDVVLIDATLPGLDFVATVRMLAESGPSVMLLIASEPTSASSRRSAPAPAAFSSRTPSPLSSSEASRSSPAVMRCCRRASRDS